MNEGLREPGGLEPTFDLHEATEPGNSENPPYNPYGQYLLSFEAGFTRIEVTDLVKEPEPDPDLDELVDGFQVRQKRK